MMFSNKQSSSTTISMFGRSENSNHGML